MKQGNLVNRIVMLALFGAVMVYLGVSLWQGFTGHIATVLCYSYTLDDLDEATGFLVREEYVLPSQGGLADVLPAEGEKVGVGQTVAYLYRDAATLERKQELRSVDLELEQLKYSLARADDLSDNAKLTGDIMTQMADLRAAVARRDFTSLEDDAMSLKSLVYKRDYTYESGGDTAGIQATIDSLTVRRDALTGQMAGTTTAVQVDRSGVFSGLVDGYETLLTPAGVSELTPSALDKLSRKTVSGQKDAVGKLVTSSRWYFVCALPEEKAKRLAEGWTVDVRFSRDWSGEVPMKVEHISAPENGRVAVAFSSTEHLSDVTLLRRQTVDIVYSSVSGIRVPKNALYQVDGQWGVYAMVGVRAEFKPVEVVGNDEEYYLVKASLTEDELLTKEARKALRPGDEIILSGGDLYDGKVMR